MRHLKYRLSICGFVLVLLSAVFAVLATNTFATEQFSIELDSHYSVSSLGSTKVVHTFTVTNNTPTIFLTQYALKTSYPDLQNVIVRYNSDILVPSVVQDTTGTSIAIEFPDSIVGEGKTRKFSIEYSSQTIASIGGQVLEVHIPQLPDAVSYSKHSTTLEVPANFIYPSRIEPTPSTFLQTPTTLVMTYDSLAGEPVSAIFGTTQLYSLSARYQLENPTSGTALTQIALPPDTSFQKLFYHTIEPYPEELKVDADGNWIATYTLPATTTIEVTITADVRVTLEPDTTIPIPTPTAAVRAADEYWQTGHAVIQDLARKYPTPEAIYQHVVQTLRYSNTEVANTTRKGAVAAFENPTDAVCQEFSDAFIAVARAAGIPARRSTGYGYSDNSSSKPLGYEGDTLHAWPEYWHESKKMWIPVDPTWESTTNGIDYFHHFDLSHLVFAINGHSSTTPYPVGTYKTNNQESVRDVTVSFASTFPDLQPNFTVTIKPKRLLTIPIPGMHEATITNTTGSAWYNLELAFDTDTPSVSISHQFDQPNLTLLPYQSKTTLLTAYTESTQLPIELQTQPKIYLNTQEQPYVANDQTITTGPIFIGYITNQNLIIGLAVGATFVTLCAGSILVFRQRRYRSLRW